MTDKESAAAEGTGEATAAVGWISMAKRVLALWWVWALGGGLAVAVIIALVSLESAPPPLSHVPEVSGPTYSVLEPATPRRQERIGTYDRTREKSQIQSGDSFMPIPQGALAPPEDSVLEPSADPLTQAIGRMRAGINDASPDPAIPASPAENTSRPPQEEDIKQIAQLFDAWRAQTMRKPEWAMIDYVATRQAATSTSDTSTSGETSSSEPPTQGKQLIAAGTVAWASLKFTYDSDLPDMPVISTLHGGRLDGATLIGHATPVRDQTVIAFDTLLWNSTSHPVEAYAVGAKSDCLALAADYDPRLFTTVFLPAAVDFITGFGLPDLAGGTRVTIADGTVIADTRAKRTRDRLLSGGVQAARGLYDRFAEVLPKGGHTRVWRGVPHAVIFTKEVRA